MASLPFKEQIPVAPTASVPLPPLSSLPRVVPAPGKIPLLHSFVASDPGPRTNCERTGFLPKAEVLGPPPLRNRERKCRAWGREGMEEEGGGGRSRKDGEPALTGLLPSARQCARPGIEGRIRGDLCPVLQRRGQGRGSRKQTNHERFSPPVGSGERRQQAAQAGQAGVGALCPQRLGWCRGDHFVVSDPSPENPRQDIS